MSQGHQAIPLSQPNPLLQVVIHVYAHGDHAHVNVQKVLLYFTSAQQFWPWLAFAFCVSRWRDCFKVFYNFCKTIEWACKRIGCLHGGLNTGPTAYKAGALPLSYEGWEPSQQRSYEGWEPSQQRSYEGMRLIKRQVRAIPLTRCYNSVRGKYTPGGGRTHDLPLRRRTRYPLRYWSVRLLPINLILS